MKGETYLNHAVDVVGAAEPQYDSNVKYLLADKQVLARILKYTVDEFKKEPIDSIISNIDNNIEVEERNVDAGETNLGRIRGTDTEDNVPNEGKITYDIRFSAYCDKEEYKILLNVEAQKSASVHRLGYHLENRVVYYLARMVSAQKHTEFFHSSYDDIKKVCSIWICMDGAQEEDSIDEIRLVRRHIFGKKKAQYTPDIMRGIIIRIRNTNHKETSKHKLIAMLETLLERRDPETKKKILVEKYGMKMTEELERRVSGVCNLSEVIKEEGMEEGRVEGEARAIVSIVERYMERHDCLAADACDVIGYEIGEYFRAKEFLERGK